MLTVSSFAFNFWLIVAIYRFGGACALIRHGAMAKRGRFEIMVWAALWPIFMLISAYQRHRNG